MEFRKRRQYKNPRKSAKKERTTGLLRGKASRSPHKNKTTKKASVRAFDP